MDFVGQCELHKAQHISIVLPGSDYQRDTTTICARGWRGNLSALLIPHYIHRLIQSVPQRTPHRLEFYQGLRLAHIPQVRPPTVGDGTGCFLEGLLSPSSAGLD